MFRALREGKMPSPSPATSAHSCHSCPDLNIDHEGCSPDGFRIGTFGSPYNDMGSFAVAFALLTLYYQ
jgi:hypothetical protein